MESRGSDGTSLVALRKATDALVKAKRTGDQTAEAVAALDIAEARLTKDGPALALTSALEAQEIVLRLSSKDLEFRAKHVLAQVHLAKRSSEEAVKASTEMLSLAKEMKSHGNAALAHRSMALACKLQGLYEEALREAKSALELQRREGDVPGEAEALLTLAEVDLAMDLHEEAERAARWAMKLFRDCGSGKGTAAALDLLVRSLAASGQYSEAQGVAEMELAALQAAGDRSAEARALCAPVRARLAGEDYDAALRAAEAALNRVQALGTRREEAQVLLSLADAKMKKGLFEQAIRAATTALAIFSKVGEWEGERQAHQLLTVACAAVGQQPPDSPFREEALATVRELAVAVDARNVEAFNAAVTRMCDVGDFFIEKDFQEALGPLAAKDRQGMLDFFDSHGPPELVELALRLFAEGGAENEDAGGAAVATFAEVGDAARAKKVDCGKQMASKWMYMGIRAGMLVYGPRFRQVDGFVSNVGPVPLVQATIRPSSMADDWEIEGYDWNPAVVDAAAHAGFGVGYIG